MPPLSVAVVGGGVAGLVAARRLDALGHHVTLLEAGPRLGGQLRTETVGGHRVDVGAEALHVAGPHLSALVDEIGLHDELVTPAPSSTLIWTAAGLRRLPAGFGPTGPARLLPLIGGRVLSPRGLARAALEPVVPRTRVGDDISVGQLLGHRFGRQLTERLVDPLLGSLHSGDVNRISARAVTPQLAATVTARRSLLLARRRQAPPPMSFATLPAGLGSLPERLLEGTAVDVHRSTPVRRIVPSAGGYRVELGGGETRQVDAVVLAVPAAAASEVLGALVPDTGSSLSGMRTASVVTVVAAYPRRALDATAAMRSTGMLVPSSAGWLLKAATFLSAKWPHLVDPAVGLVRLSAGRVGSSAVEDLDDDQLVGRLHRELAEATGLSAAPDEVHVQRWPRALTQLEVGHQTRLAAVRAELAAHPGVVLAGASYEGLGVSACVRSGVEAADAVHAGLVPVGGHR